MGMTHIFFAMNVREITKQLNDASPDGGWLQSEVWRAFQEAAGHRTLHFESVDAWANVVEYVLPIVGKYWYVARGPLQKSNIKYQISKSIEHKLNQGLVEGEVGNPGVGSEGRDLNDEQAVLMLWERIEQEARKEGIGWIRFDPVSDKLLRVLEQVGSGDLRKAPHDMQPREIFVVDISQSEEELLADMKPKTRYNIRLAEKHGVRIIEASNEEQYQQAFLDMIDRTAARKGIDFHPRLYYETFFCVVPKEYWELLVAEHVGGVLAANLLVFFGDAATYLYGASGDEGREHMAPYLLQWEGMLRARERGCARYDFGGVNTVGERLSLSGVTRFKRGFAPSVKAIQFSGSYDRVLKESHYRLYRALQMSKNFVIKAKRHLTKK